MYQVGLDDGMNDGVDGVDGADGGYHDGLCVGCAVFSHSLHEVGQFSLISSHWSLVYSHSTRKSSSSRQSTSTFSSQGKF